ncbi:hypothetical protein SAMN04487895_101643 [Paenibacillus sophorae]|uniref:Uncharacterized protein n=1 Tax=Paenibacillus sophorae TaxID=1333845 RepID=A0A1H8GV94_9BACL|nr:hypothetical protein [Paenibacillus sophorae]QWU14341.1 hypothetical protein KP014_20760 [Paenibacillus sophorae]SEN47397.1 hypothetical protein SAMN04487895_101643 [Paenibacillus sophorae]
MGSALVYILFSMIDGVSILTFAFGSFKVDLKSYWKEIFLTAFIISTGNYFLSQHDNFQNYTSVFSLILLFLSLLFYFRISVFSSIRLTIIGFVSQAIIQLVLVLITTMVIHTNISEIQENDFLRCLLQIISGSIMILSSVLMRRKRLYFTTLPYDYSYKIKFTKVNTILILSSIVVVIMFLNISRFNNIIVEILFWILCIFNIYVLETKKQMRDDID